MTESVLITSLANPSVKRYKSLSTRRRQRYRDRLFVAEGQRTIRTLLDNGSVPVEIIFGESATPGWVAEIFDLVSGYDVKVTNVTDSLFRQLSDTVQPQFVCAVMAMQRKKPPETSSFVLVVDGVQDPGNVGSIIRTAVAADIDAVVTMPGTVDLYSPKVVRASAGLVESIPVVAIKSLDEAISMCFREQPQIVLADANSEMSYTSLDWTKHTLLIVGNEAHGSNELVVDKADITASILMSKAAESMNVSAATAVLLFEANRQRFLRN